MQQSAANKAKIKIQYQKPTFPLITKQECRFFISYFEPALQRLHGAVE